MEQFELVEKLVSTFGVSYEKAKEALEASNWNAVEAAVYLEREKTAGGNTSTGTYGEQCSENKYRKTKGCGFNIPVDNMRETGTNVLKTCWEFLSMNSVVVKKDSGVVFLSIPIWLALILVCAFFWPIFMIAGVLFVMGYRFSISGPVFEKDYVKGTMNKMENAAKDFVQKVKNSIAPDECEPSGNGAEQAAESEKKEENPTEE